MAAPSVISTSGLPMLTVATPERLSLAVNGIDTFILFQPAALGVGVGESKVTVGGVLSICTVTVLGVSRFPALSVAKYVIVVMPSVEIVVAALFPATSAEPVCAPRSV